METGERTDAVSAGTRSASTGQRVADSAGRPETRRWWAPAAVSLAALMTYLDEMAP